MREAFRKAAEAVASAAGMPVTFIAAVLLIAAWGLTGPIFHYSDTWQLVINTGTTIITFLMVFLLQNTANREARATQIKLDELLRAVRSARNSIIDVEDLSDEDLDELLDEYASLTKRYSSVREQREHAGKTGGRKKRKGTA